MAIDVDKEELHLLSDSSKWWPRVDDESPPSFPTGSRWAVTGLRARDGRRVKLESVLLGRRRYTSTEAARRFIAALNAADQPPFAPADVAADVAANGRKAAEEYRAMTRPA